MSSAERIRPAPRGGDNNSEILNNFTAIEEFRSPALNLHTFFLPFAKISGFSGGNCRISEVELHRVEIVACYLEIGPECVLGSYEIFFLRFTNWGDDDQSSDCGHVVVPHAHPIVPVPATMRAPGHKMEPYTNSWFEECRTWMQRQEEIEPASNWERENQRACWKGVHIRSVETCKHLICCTLFFQLCVSILFV